MADTATVPAKASTFSFMSIHMFKEQVGATKLEVLRSPKPGGGIFVSADNGQTYNCAQAFDPKKPASILIPDDDISRACLINPSNQAEVLASL